MEPIFDRAAAAALARDEMGIVGAEQHNAEVADVAVAGARMDSNVVAADAGGTMADTVLVGAERAVDEQPVATVAKHWSYQPHSHSEIAVDR
mgnify:CR=1 FL=1